MKGIYIDLFDRATFSAPHPIHITERKLEHDINMYTIVFVPRGLHPTLDFLVLLDSSE